MKYNFRKILFPTDFSETASNAFRNALWIADKLKASIHILHAVYPEVEPMDYPVLTGQATEQRLKTANGVMQSFVEVGLTQVQAAYQLENVPEIHKEVLLGTPSSLIADKVEDEHIDLVIMGTHGEHDLLDRTFGSTTTATIKKVDCPVMVIPDTTVFAQISNVAYATDMNESDPYHIWEVSKMLMPFEPSLRIIHIDQEGREVSPLTIRQLEDFFHDHPPALQFSFHNIPGKDIPRELNNVAAEWNIDLIVMLRPHRSFLERLFHKSLTREAALHTKVPLLVLR